MNIVTFKRGIHPPYRKEATASSPIQRLETGPVVVIPLLQHLGAVCTPLVKKGDYVRMGQKIGDSEAFMSSPVHSSVSGTVAAVEKHPHPNGTQVMSVIIENDFHYDVCTDEIAPHQDYQKMTPAQIIQTIRAAGIVGMGGAGFPVHIKVNIPKDKKAQYVIVNGAECEPYLSSDHRAMVEYPEMIVEGLRILMKATGAPHGIIAIENNKLDAEKLLSDLTKDDPSIEIALMQTKYPQGSEKHIIKAVLGREVPSGKLPIDVGVVVNNIDTCISIVRAITQGRPLVKRRVTLAGGAVKHPGVYEVSIGMTFGELVEKAGGMIPHKVHKILMGGPMMGIAQSSLDVPIIKTTSGVLLLSQEESRVFQEQPCTKCGKCVGVCPMGLMPLFAAIAGKKGDLESAEKYHAADCIECGCCSYTCPSHRFLVENIRLAKAMVLANRKKG